MVWSAGPAGGLRNCLDPGERGAITLQHALGDLAARRDEGEAEQQLLEIELAGGSAESIETRIVELDPLRITSAFSRI